jgi:starch-binding outer membrane protein, SusD/RagB family
MNLRSSILSIACGSALLGACNNVLDTSPYDRVPASQEIVDAATAQAALNGAYDAMQSSGVYGLDLEVLSELAADNSTWSGTYQFLGDVSNNLISADNPEVANMWTGLYRQIDRDNTVIQRTSALANVPDATKNEIVGEAYFLRALSYHNLVKYFGAVPMPLVPVAVASEAAQYTRAPVDQVYTQILADLDQAAKFVANTSDTRRATVNAIKAIRARVLFYRGTTSNSAGDLQAALDGANAVLTAMKDTLTVAYPDLFSATGSNTAEDIFRVSFTASESNNLGYYYLYAGRYEASATPDIFAAYEAGDVRKAWSVTLRPKSTTRYQATKFPTTIGAEHPHVIRLAELVLMKAEILARQNDLAGAVAEYNKVRVRAGLPKHVLGTQVTTQADVLAAIDRDRRLELAFEGDRWPDLVRQGRAVAIKGFSDRAYQLLFPIPVHDITTTPGLTQNPGYAKP